MRIAIVAAGILLGAAIAIGGWFTWWINAALVALLLFVPAVRCFSAGALIGGAAFRIAALIRLNIAVVPEWDFRVFWLHAQLAVRGVDFYDRAVVRGFLSAVHASPSFIENGRFWNPPQAMLFFLPLGYIDDLNLAYALWYVAMLCALAASAWLLAKDYAPAAVAVALFVSMEPTFITFWVGQTNFFVLLLLLLGWKYRDRFGGGALIAVGVVLKPILLCLLLEPLVRKRVRTLLGFVAGAAVLTIASIAAFGWRVHVHYISSGAGEVQRELLLSIRNRSLLATLLRADVPAARVLYVIAAIAAGAAVLYVIVKTTDATLAIAALTAAALLLYPQTLDSYGVLLIVPVLALWRVPGRVGASLAWIVHTLSGAMPPLLPFASTAAASAIALAASVAFTRFRRTADR